MADVKISALPVSTTPLAGTEVLPVVQSGATVQVSVANLTAGRAVSASSLNVTGVSTLTGGAVIQGLSAGLGANAVANNTVFGVNALKNAGLTGAGNTAFGTTALFSNASGANNVANGASSLFANSDGNNNTANGALSLFSNVSGNNNLALGYNAGYAITGNNNTIIGSVAGTAGLSDTVIIAAGTTERLRIDSLGNSISSPTATPPTLATNGQMVINFTSNTNLRISVRGSDGTTRVANITLT